MKYFIGVHSPNKAKMDIDAIMLSMGFANVLPEKTLDRKGKFSIFFGKIFGVLKLFFVLKKGDVLLIQYPFKKFYGIQCRVARAKGAKTVTLIHDLGTFRRKKLTAEQEIQRLSRTDAIIVHNESMKNWLLRHGCKVPMTNLEIFDYLSSSEPETGRKSASGGHCRVMYAGGLSRRKNAFLFDINPLIGGCRLDVYGRCDEEFSELSKTWENVNYCGFKASDDFIAEVDADYGLVWDGDSPTGCAGNWGEYLKLNNPHKTSFYIRAGLPVVVWSESAMAPFVRENKLGICVGSLENLHDEIEKISAEDYAEMKSSVLLCKDRLNQGFYFKKAFCAAIKNIS